MGRALGEPVSHCVWCKNFFLIYFLIGGKLLYNVVLVSAIVNEVLNSNLSLQGNMGLNFQGPKGEKVSREKS